MEATKNTQMSVTKRSIIKSTATPELEAKFYSKVETIFSNVDIASEYLDLYHNIITGIKITDNKLCYKSSLEYTDRSETTVTVCLYYVNVLMLSQYKYIQGAFSGYCGQLSNVVLISDDIDGKVDAHGRFTFTPDNEIDLLTKVLKTSVTRLLVSHYYPQYQRNCKHELPDCPSQLFYELVPSK